MGVPVLAPALRLERQQHDQRSPARIAGGTEQGGEALKPHSDITDPRVVKALAHPLRIQILGVLEREVASPNEIATELGAPLGNVSYHVRELSRLGMIKLVKKTPRRGAIEHYYRAEIRPRISDEGWAQTPKSVKNAMLRTALEEVGARVNAAAVEGGFDAQDAQMNRVELTLDRRGWEDLSKELGGVLERLQELEGEAAKRLAETDQAGEVRATLVTMLFETAERSNSRSPAPKPRKSRSKSRSR